MKPSKAQQTLLGYANDMLALERDIKEAVDRQAEDEGVLKHAQVAAVVREIALATDVRVAAMGA